MNKSKLFFALVTLFAVFAFSSCTDLNDETEFIQNDKTRAAEKTMRRGGIND